MKKKVILALVAILVLIQFIRIDKSVPTVPEGAKDITASMEVPSDIALMLKTSCYDCHSNETVYPWYSNIAPVSWLLGNHIKDGRKHLNFSVWSTYPDKRMKHKMEECAELVEEGEMPMDQYLWMHSNAKLNSDQTAKLVDWFKANSH
ncbi:MAG: cytochrome C [Bacteroidetes bacterium]|nr:cytochrome C [Bacteroidota bacterium]